MVGSNGTMIAIRLVRSKLRKREEHSNSVHPADVVLQTATAAPVATQPPSVPQALQADTLTYQGQFLWPPPPQPYLYNNDQVGYLPLFDFCAFFHSPDRSLKRWKVKLGESVSYRLVSCAKETEIQHQPGPSNYV